MESKLQGENGGMSKNEYAIKVFRLEEQLKLQKVLSDFGIYFPEKYERKKKTS